MMRNICSDNIITATTRLPKQYFMKSTICSNEVIHNWYMSDFNKIKN